VSVKKTTVIVACVALTACLPSLGLAAAGDGGRSATTFKGPTLNIAEFVDFSGPNSADGPVVGAGCLTGADAINAAGGVLGHRIECVREDAGSDPADAVPAANRMLVDTSNLVLIQGPYEVAPAVEPIIRNAKIVMMSENGDPRFNSNSDPYFYRLLPGDDVQGKAMAYWAWKAGLKRVAAVFDNGPGAQAITGSLKAAYTKLGGTFTTFLSIAADQPSYRTEVQQLLSSRPQAILTETDGQTAATFFSELLSLNNGKMLPVQGTSATYIPQYEEPLTKVLGAANVHNFFEATALATLSANPALAQYQQYLKTVGSAVPGAAQYANLSYSASIYDSTIVAALAMTEAKSAVPAKYQPFVSKVTGPLGPGRVAVHTYAAGLAALKAGKAIVYVGTGGGPILWDSHHNVQGTWDAFKYDPATKANVQIGSIPPSVLARL
jgi:branched-chain amino acid transport system substrate-binding protein